MFKKLKQQTGAIFGIDARIAIAIFAMLSLTAGYIALGKLDTVRVANTLKELEAIDQALKEMQTDMGVFYPQALIESNGYDDFKALWDNTYLRTRFNRVWNGPYYSKETNDHALFGGYSLAYLRDDLSPCESTGDCYVFIELSEVPFETWLAINMYVDEGNGTTPEAHEREHLTGQIRTRNTEAEVTLMYRSVNKKWNK